MRWKSAANNFTSFQSFDDMMNQLRFQILIIILNINNKIDNIDQ